MYIALAGTSSVLKSIGQLITLLFIFAFVVFLAYLSSKMASKMQMRNLHNSNLEVIETMRIANNKYLQLVRAGQQYFVIGVGKDEIHLISEVQKETLVEKQKLDSFGKQKVNEENFSKFQQIYQKLKNSNDK